MGSVGKKLTIVTTMGTSIFDNLQKLVDNDLIERGTIDVVKDIQPDVDNNENKYVTCYWEDRSLKDNFRKLTNKIIDKIVDSGKLHDYMAEVSSIEGIIREKKKEKEEKEEYTSFEIIPICSDTAISVIAAEILRRYYENESRIKGINIKVHFRYPYNNDNGIDKSNVYYEGEIEGNENKCPNNTNFIIKGLQVFDGEEFEKEGLANLFLALKCIYEKFDNKDLIFNVTGGYKAIIPYMIIFSQVYNIPVYYMFENTKNPLRIPQLPIDLDLWTLDENFTALKEIHRKRDKNLPTVDEFKNDYLPKGVAKEIVDRLEKKKILEEFEYKDKTKVKTKVKLTFYGNLLMDRFKSRGDNRQNIASLLVELQLFKFFINNYKGKLENVEHSKKIKGKDNNENEIDVFVEFNEPIKRIGSGEEVKYICAEVKPAGNVPIWGNNKNTLEHSLKEGGLKKCFDEYQKNGKKVELAIYLYGIHRELPKAVMEQLHKLIDHLDDEQFRKAVRVYLLKLPKNFKSNNHWVISEEKEESVSENKKRGKIIDLTREIMNTDYKNDTNAKINKGGNVCF